MRNQHARYAPLAIALHWFVAFLIVCALGLALTRWGMSLSPLKQKLLAWHKWTGITILLFVLLRIIVRIVFKPPPLPAHMSLLERYLAHIGHGVLYVLMLITPLCGWAMSSAYGVDVVYLGLWPLPNLVAPNDALGQQFKSLHQLLNIMLAICIVGHIIMAFKHHFIDKDGLLWRMSLCARRDL